MRTTTPAGRDAALRRLRTLNRVLIGAAVAATGLLSEVAAQAFPGHKRAVTPVRQATPSSGSAERAAARPTHHHRHHRLRAPAQSPAAAPAQTATSQASPAQTATAQATPAQTATVQAAPAPVPTAPAPVISGGS